MSWFDASGLASIAKTALKEAQKTIDKALDIKDDLNAIPVNTPIDTNPDDFFGTWGITESGHIKEDKKFPNDALKQARNSNSIWGSFSGSFFETAAAHKAQKSISIDSLDDSLDMGTEHFSSSKLVVHHSDDIDSQLSRISISELNENFHINKENLKPVDENQDVVVKRVEKPNALHVNRLSAISIESERNSSASLDIISPSTEWTTSPESDMLSVAHSLSTSSSAIGSKQVSESVEIVPESLTSPSSVEVLGTESSSRRESQQNTDDFVSPIESPWEKSSSSIEKISPESVEIIPEDQDETSVAEDTMSYTSISESTSATVLDSAFNMFKSQKMLKDTYIRNEVMTESGASDLSQNSDSIFIGTEAITRAPSRSTMNLPLAQVNQVLIDTQPQSTNQDMPNILKKTNVIDFSQDNDSVKSENIENLMDTSTDEGSQSDKTIMASDNIMESSSDTSTTETSGHSSYLKNMLADAMTEKSSEHSNQLYDLSQGVMLNSSKEEALENITISQLDMPAREHSPISSESRSDLVKIGSDYTSGHTSGDELETTTSSDLEIISSPNGDSSSTQSRQSPAKQTIHHKIKTDGCSVDSLLSKMTMKKAKGHNRELSEASSISDDSHSSEVEKLIKRISEMTEILESRESKLIDVNRRNAELQDINNDLKYQLDSFLSKQLESAELFQVTEEYTQRLSALEKKFQQAIREKDTLRKQLEHSKQDAATKMSKSDLESLISEKDETIKELREEGEKLSKQQLQHSNIIKKLRAKEKENEITIKHMKENIESLSTETERLKRSLTAKEEVERSQIEAVYQLTAKNKKIETELAKLQSELDDLKQKYDTTKKSLDAAKKELQDKNRTGSELLAREQMLESLENQKRATESQNEEIMGQLESLRLKLRQCDQDYLKKELGLKNENNELLQRLEEAEARNEELSQSILEVSKPLVRQLESLQATHNSKVTSFESLEQQYTIKISELQTKLQATVKTEKLAKEECNGLRSKVAELEGHLSSLKHQQELFQMKVEQQKTEHQIKENDFKTEIGKIKDSLVSAQQKVEDQYSEINALQQQLKIEKEANNAERKRKELLFKEHNDPPHISGGRLSPETGSNSPTLSLGKASIADSLSSSFWSQDEPFDIAQTPRYTNMLEMQMLQTNVKQKDGELQQLQWELNRREQERSLLNLEISSLLTKVEGLESSVVELKTLKTQFIEVQQQYDTLCQLYGEKVEENEELKLDLLDVKEMYKAQIDELLRQQKQQLK
ncbi:unnamed protein product [Brassicogethes aeneus]|uniref:TATA element modulatory factor 1 TATA binding domain-containing protein n=1 Tax=Brassicogethes aeneus TaxID=1431903 RepID=A0A9P0ARX9_BRAAE|nr:unnamed protein product [Brassicogethes aeneus]